MGEPNQDSKKILIVEDEPNILDIYTRILTKQGYAVTGVADGEKGYDEMLKGTYDLVLLDVMLPAMSGIDVLKKIKAALPDPLPFKVLMLTNLDQDLTIADSISSGATGYLIKSQMSNEKLLEEVAKNLE